MPPPIRPSWQRNLPNWLTIGRCALAAIFFAVLSVWDFPGSAAEAGRLDPVLLGAAVLFAIAAATDALDGLLARRWQVVSVFGRVMDPFADKVLVIGAYVILAGPAFAAPVMLPLLGTPASIEGRPLVGLVNLTGIAPWMVVVILARELLVTSIRGAYEARGISFAAGPSGKAKMILQSVHVPLVLVLACFATTRHGNGSLQVTGAYTLNVVLAYLAVLVTVWSGIPYISKAVRESRNARGGAGAGATTPTP